jgi:hypothetical protein
VLRQLLPAAVAACLLIVVPATSAQAAPATAKVSGSAAAREPRLATMTQQAARYWNDGLGRCAEGVQVLLGDSSQAPTPDAWAWAEVGGCSLWINTSNRDAWPLKDDNLLPWCNVMAHEYGHLRGLEHVADAKSIMNAIVPMASAQCGEWDKPGTSTGAFAQGTGSSAGRPAIRKAATRKRCARSTSRRAKRAGRTCKRAAEAKKTTRRKRSRTARSSTAIAS